MTPEVKKAMERLRTVDAFEEFDETEKFYQEHGFSDVEAALWHDKELIYQAFLAEHPADEDEPITEEWLRGIGFEEDKKSVCWRINYCRLYLNIRFTGQWWMYEMHSASTYGGSVSGYKKITTRGQIRLLLRALGIEYQPN